MPFPSAGCQTCRSRRIKCDGTKPRCQRCSKSRLYCLDTSAHQQASFTIHVENCYASGETKRPRGPRSSLTLLRPHCNLQSRALAYYLNYHLQTLTDAPHVPGCLAELVCAWRGSGRSCDMVDLAISTIALAVFSKTQHHPPAIAEASTRYYHLLRLARQRIAQLRITAGSSTDFDACLLTVLLMGRYEGVIYCSSDRNSRVSLMPTESWSHHEGAMAILKVWNEKPTHISPTRIITESRRGLIRFSILGDLPLPGWVLDGGRFGEPDFELDFDRITTRMVKLRATLKSLLQKSYVQDTEAKKLYVKACNLDKVWRDWAAGYPDTWCYQLHKLAEDGPWPRRHFYSSTVYSCSKPGYAALWSQYFAARMLINSIRVKALTFLHDSNSCSGFSAEQQRQDCTTQLAAMADNLASTIPFCLEMFKPINHKSLNKLPSNTVNNTQEIKPYLASWIVWPLAIACSIGEIDVPLQKWFRSELATVGKVLGDGVLSEADTDHWDTL